MGETPRPTDLAKKTVVCQLPGMDAVTVRRGVGYDSSDGDFLAMDVYLPTGPSGGPAPAVVIAAGYPDPGFAAKLGCSFKDMGSSVSWGRLIAASGLAAVTYTNREPAADLGALLRYLRRSGPTLGIDESRIALWACSGNVPLALSIVMHDGLERPKCAVLAYGYTLDLDGSTAVADAARMFGFVNPASGKSADDLPRDVPLFVARAGKDEVPRLNETLDRFMGAALARNLPVTLVNHPTAPHAFDLFDDSDGTREIIREILAFLRFHLLRTAESPGNVPSTGHHSG
jgi:hypothetical protein